MTGLIIAVAVLAVAGLLVWTMRSRRSRFPVPESLGNPNPDRWEPLIRGESRHHDTPGPADLDVHGGREHGG